MNAVTRLAVRSGSFVALMLALINSAHADGSWAATFVPNRLFDSIGGQFSSIVVVPAGDHVERDQAAVALMQALRASGRLSLVMDWGALGNVASLDDRSIVGRAANLPVAVVAVIRVFGGEGERTTAVVAYYDKSVRTLGALTGDRGVPLAPGSGAGQGVSPGASNAVSQAVQQAAPPGVQQAPVDEQQPQPGTVPVTISSKGRPLQLSAIVDNSSGFFGGYFLHVVRYRSLCPTPCTLYLRPGENELRVGGHGVRPAIANFIVPPSGADLTMRAPSSGAFAGGFMLVTFGGVAMITGATVLALAYTSFANPTSVDPATGQSTTVNDNGAWVFGGALTLGIGTAMLGGGIALLALNRGGVASIQPRQRASLTPVIGPTGIGVKGTF
jgi:hypothetical protein